MAKGGIEHEKALYVIVIMILIMLSASSAFLVADTYWKARSRQIVTKTLRTSKIRRRQRPHTGDEALDCDRTLKPGFEVISDPTVEGGILLDYAELHDMNPDLAAGSRSKAPRWITP